jgi:hypothetical protein
MKTREKMPINIDVIKADSVPVEFKSFLLHYGPAIHFRYFSGMLSYWNSSY